MLILHATVTFVDFTTKFCIKFSQVVYISATSHQSKSFHIVTIVTLEDLFESQYAKTVSSKV